MSLEGSSGARRNDPRAKHCNVHRAPGSEQIKMKDLLAHYHHGHAAAHIPADRLTEFIDYKVQERMINTHGKYNDPREISNCERAAAMFIEDLSGLGKIEIFRNERSKKSVIKWRVTQTCLRALAMVVEKQHDVTNSVEIGKWSQSILSFASEFWQRKSDAWFLDDETTRRSHPNIDTMCFEFERHLDEFLRKNGVR